GVERRVVADEPEQLRRLLADVLHVEAELARPARPLAFRLAERVAGLVDRLERRLQHWIELSDLDEAAAELVDDRHVLDPHGADLDARHALRARPDRLRADPLAYLRLQPFMGGELAQVEDDVSGRERIARGGRRARDMALAALRARVERDEMLPREVADDAVAHLLGRRSRRQQRQPLPAAAVTHRHV